MRRLSLLAAIVLLFPPVFAGAGDKEGDDDKALIRALRSIDKFPLDEKVDYGAALRKRRDAFNLKDVEKWKAITAQKDWDKRRQEVVAALREFVVPPFTPQKEVKQLVTSTVPGEGFVIENVVYETVPGLVVTANLYRPEPAVKNPPAILIISSHHNPKTQGELQDMGMTWARLGCLVLVPDQLGHGERRQHPFKDAASYPDMFKIGRQDYYFRYNVGVQLALIGESLCGWMARDMMRGVDLVLERGADPKRVILLGSVAGGGDPAGVTAAVDERIACVVPFNFGGPQPETKFPLPKDAELSFNYFGGGSWESTRNLSFSMSGGFPHWAIVAAAAPRKLIHAHEFAWDKDNDPVWKRYQKIWGWYGDPDGIGFAHGSGSVTGMAPESTHCNNIGPAHRAMIYPYLKKWFGIPIPEKEYQNRVPSEKLLCLNDKAIALFKPKMVAELARERGAKEGTAGPRSPSLVQLLDCRPWPKATETAVEKPGEAKGRFDMARTLISDENGLRIAAITFLTKGSASKARPLVVGVAQQGAAGFLKDRSEAIAELLEGAAVALVDVRGAGVLGFPGDGRGRGSVGTSHSSTEWMMGHTLLEQRLRDLKTALGFLREKKGIDAKRIALWGDSFAPVNDEKTVVATPYDVDKQPRVSEPLGPILALFAASSEPDIRGVYGRGGLTAYRALLDGPYIWTPHDVLVPGIVRGDDLPLLTAHLAPRSVRLEGLVNGLNRTATATELEIYAPAWTAYIKAKAEERLSVGAATSAPSELAAWLLRAIE